MVGRSGVPDGASLTLSFPIPTPQIVFGLTMLKVHRLMPNSSL